MASAIAVARAEAGLAGLVIWHEAPFGAGADLQEVMALIEAGRFDELDHLVRDFQDSLRRVGQARWRDAVRRVLSHG